jgi:hypothetical protein
MKPNWLMMAIAIGARQLYHPFKIRVRQWGGLPVDRGPTVLITNHQFIDEGEIVISRVFLRHPWKRLVMVNSRRTFETGFFAARLPWTARWTRHLDPSGLWARFSILPVENHLFSRTLLSLAEEIRGAHGDLALETFLPAERVAELGLAGRHIAELWEMPWFFKAQATVKIAHLKDPYRREALERFRATSAADIERIVDAVRAGATFYVTPEGDFSRDGRMHRMRGGITDAVLPFADAYLCAIAYDPFRGRRLGMLYRIVRPADPADLGTSLAAARPVTTSALLARALLQRNAPLRAEDATIAVSAQLSALPRNVFVDPDLRHHPDAAVGDALSGLVRRGTLECANGRYALTERRTDPRFPHIADMVTYQRNMIDETIACACALTDRARPDAFSATVPR